MYVVAYQPEGGYMDNNGNLTNRQKEVLILITHNKTTEEIAQELLLSKRTVEVHKMAITRRLKLLSYNDQLKQYAHNHNLI